MERRQVGSAGGGCRRFFLCLRGLLSALGRLCAVFLGESLDAPFCVDELLPAGEERVAVGADLQVQLRLGRSRLPRISARAADLDLVVLGMDSLLHNRLLGLSGKTPL